MDILEILKIFKLGRKSQRNLPNFEQGADFSKTRDITTPQTRDIKAGSRSLQAAQPGDVSQAKACGCQVEMVPITDVQPGDYVLSLNEETLKIEPHRINALLDTGERIAVPRNINGRVFYGVHDSDQSTLAQVLLPEIQEQPITLTSSISFLFSRLNQETTNQKCYAYNKQSYSQDCREPFKEVTDQSNSKNCFAQVCYNLGNKFSPSIVYDIHRYIIYHTARGLSTLRNTPMTSIGACFLTPFTLNQQGGLTCI